MSEGRIIDYSRNQFHDMSHQTYMNSVEENEQFSSCCSRSRTCHGNDIQCFSTSLLHELNFGFPFDLIFLLIHKEKKMD